MLLRERHDRGAKEAAVTKADASKKAEGRSPRDGADIEGPHRLIGLEAFYLMQYINWWNRIPRTGATPAAREDALSERIRLLTRSDSHPTPDPGFGWCFTSLREVAGCVAMHGFAAMVSEEMATRNRLLDNIVRG